MNIIFSPQVIAALVGALSGAFLVWLKNYLDAKTALRHSKVEEKSPDKIVTALEFNNQIQERLEGLRTTFKADRISIYRFHNGGHYYPNTDMQKFSMVYEKVSSGIATLTHTHQNFLVSAFHWYLNQVIKKNAFKYPDINNIEDFTLRDFFTGMGIKSVYVFPLFSLNGNALGIISVHYIKDATELSSIELDELESEVSIFSGYLDHK